MVRIKQRYLLVHILYPDAGEPSPPWHSVNAKQPLPDIVQFHQPTPDDLTQQSLVRAIREQIAFLYGDYGVGITANGLNVKYLSHATSTAIVRCSRDNYRLVWAALTWMTHLPKATRQSQARPCVMQVVGVSGTIKKAEEEAIRRAQAAILKAKSGTDGSVTMGLDAILGQPNAAPTIGHHKGRGEAMTGIEDEDDEDDEGTENNSDEND